MKRLASLVCPQFLLHSPSIGTNERYISNLASGNKIKNRRRRQSILVAIDNGPIKLRIPVNARLSVRSRFDQEYPGSAVSSRGTPLTSIFLRSIESTGARRERAIKKKNAEPRVVRASSLRRLCPYRFSRFLRQRIVRSRKILISRLASVGFIKRSSVLFRS